MGKDFSKKNNDSHSRLIVRTNWINRIEGGYKMRKFSSNDWDIAVLIVCLFWIFIIILSGFGFFH